MSETGGFQQGEWQAWVVPMVAGFMVATAAVALLVPPRAHSLTWPDVAWHSAGLLTLAAAAVVAGVWGMHRAFRESIGSRPAASVVACAWSAAIWLPLMLLLHAEHGLWVIAAPLPITVIVTRFSKRQAMQQDAAEEETASVQDRLFASVAELRRDRITGTAILSGALVQGVLTAAAVRSYPWAESLLIVLTAVLVWAFSGRRGHTDGSVIAERFWRRSSVLPCFLLTCLALTPFLREGLASAQLRNMVLAGVVQKVSPRRSLPGGAYTSAILTSLAQPRQHIEVPAPPVPGALLALHKPLLIPFDGVYWFFQYPDKRPGKGAHIQRGDPTTHFYSSSGRLPMLMEAHQRLRTTLSTGCCSGLRVDVQNADNRIGAIAVEVILRNGSGPDAPSRSLGTVPIRSSQLQRISLNRDPVEESLHFRMRGGSSFRFDNIDLIFHIARDRDLASARVKINGFVLEP